MIPRRQFLAASLASLTVASSSRLVAAESKANNPLCVFTKPFNSLSFDELATEIARLGFDGIEAPIRRGGHVEPERVPDDLPRLVEALAKRDLTITLMTTDINDPADPTTEKVLRAAATLGIQRYRMKYFRYDDDLPIRDQLANWHDQLVDLAAMNHDFNLTGLYQNHAGTKYFGAPLWDLATVLEGIEPTDIGVAYDIRHATVEGGTSWPTTFRRIQPHIDTVYVKDFRWNDDKIVDVPLGEGRVAKKFFEMLREINFAGPISLHEEYLSHKEPKLVPKHLEAIGKDLDTLQGLLAG
ncbi:MAG: sugar phosphate isomerase/epimerase family protein [Planctomycetota bacterium]